VIGIATIIAMAWLLAFGLGFSPADRDQAEAVRILYVHVPTIWIAYLAFVVTALSSALYLFGKRHSLGWDRLAGASAEIGVTFVAVTLVVGALWGRLTWGVFWQWDARLTTTALLFVTYIGYLAVRRLGGSHQQRARRSAVLGLLAVLEIPLVHWSVRLWRSLHQEATVLDTDGDIDMDGLMLFSLFVGVIAFTLLYLWLVMHRTRAMAMEDLLDDHALDRALEERRAEATDERPGGG
jgi:heme exporter protein C